MFGELTVEMLESYKEKIESSKYEYIPIVLGSNINALGIVRSLRENQLPVIVMTMKTV